MQKRRGEKRKQHLKWELECERKPLKPRSIHVTVKFGVCTAVTVRGIIFNDVTPYKYTKCWKKRTVFSFKVMDVKKEAAGYLER
jgi:hypothetical protein